MNTYQKGITSDVFTIKSQIEVKNLVEKIILKKCKATSDWINSLNVDIQKSVIVGAYLTGIGLSKLLKKTSDVTLVDIYPHMENIVDKDVKFCCEIDVIEDADLVIDTTGLGGLTPDITKLITGKAFLVEDPTSDGSDETIKRNNNIMARLKAANANHEGVLKTQGLNSKTSGTMTITMEILRKSLADALSKPGVLYGVAGMEFYEGVLFKEKDVNKFSKLMQKPALTISTMEPFSFDAMIEEYLDKVCCHVEDVNF